MSAEVDYWREALNGAPALLDLPFDRKRPERQDFSGAYIEWRLDKATTTRLSTLAQSCGCTLFMAVLAGWVVVLSRLSGQEDVVVGVPSVNRSRPELADLIGFFVNTLPIRLRLDTFNDVYDLLTGTKAAVLGAQENQDVPFEHIVEMTQAPRDLAYSPVIQVLLAWQNNTEGHFSFDGLMAAEVEPPRRTAKFDVTLHLTEKDGCVVGGIEYASALLDHETVLRWGGHLRTVLHEMVAGPHQRLEDITLLTPDERHKMLVEWNKTEVPFPTLTCIHELFEQQVDRSPDALAVVYEDECLTYRDLNAKANKLARYLVGCGIGPDQLVGICLERSADMVVGLLAVLKAGGAYLPLDPAYPTDRLRIMLVDAEPKALIIHGATTDVVSKVTENLATPPDVLSFDSVAPWAHQSTENVPPSSIGLTSSNLAYVMYTSGSTGRPKGVMVEHLPLVNLIADNIPRIQSISQSRVLQLASPSFDMSFHDVFTTVCNGGRLYLPQRHILVDPPALLDFMSVNGITTVFIPTAMLHEICTSSYQSELEKFVSSGAALRTVLTGGEHLRLTPQVGTLLGSSSDGLLVNVYGPSETHICTTYEIVAWAPATWPSHSRIGKPIRNSAIYILDHRLRPVPVGVVGEIYIGGICLARGYIRRAALTSSRFIADPFSSASRLYRTGDLARYRDDGEIELVGRNDHQVKMNGFRVELGEIEATVLSHPKVAAAVTTSYSSSAGDTLLACFYTASDRSDVPAPDDVRRFVETLLPAYMRPTSYLFVQSMPLTGNGKIDRSKLPSPTAQVDRNIAREGARSPLEAVVIETWAALLDRTGIGRTDNFFHLGGHSLLAVRVATQLAQRFGIKLTAADIFRNATAEQLGERIQAAQALNNPATMTSSSVYGSI